MCTLLTNLLTVNFPAFAAGGPNPWSRFADTPLGSGWLCLSRCLWAGRGPRCTAWGQQEAATEEIEASAAKHLAFQHVEAINMPLHGSRTLGQGHPGLDRRIVVPQPLG